MPEEIDASMVRLLVADQFPSWSGLPVAPVPQQGWDNRTFRIGSELSARLPAGPAYVAAVGKEQRALACLDGCLPVAIPTPVALGSPGHGYPYPWSIRRWLDGSTVADTPDLDRRQFAHDLGEVLHTLHQLPAETGPAAGRHSHYRGCHPSAYSDQVDTALHQLRGTTDAAAAFDDRQCRRIWLDATTHVWPLPPVWFHGDIAPGNLLTASGQLSAIIDFGSCGVGDPACDLAIAWTYFAPPERAIFRDAVRLDEQTWKRARGWALWKALVTMAGMSSPDPDGTQAQALQEVLGESP
ncbi:hypothetical protein AD006_30105 (plasmid) [Pseudonocardia sp. EC080610-09]|uniref:aminoglycoside phosphotransferase family protein n=1 Tax=unclassified Pseudonocardia TaxID=2619320 RepID=UPI0007067A78|nr:MULTISPECIES: aminoglycoside phosphotransferase family protein [unclassified Pseudonocardia]ALL79495.1 hypothetical protein AD006_30105 [Pseudonocardia sp. EC080610-09]ALL85552.1 hypothetical protein AD017_31145 [Pseudonocardia sp. EC080619-01]